MNLEQVKNMMIPDIELQWGEKVKPPTREVENSASQRSSAIFTEIMVMNTDGTV
jgi:hypothetical protein